MTLTNHGHIHGVTGRRSIGVVVAGSVKNPVKGFPDEKDRFHILNPSPEKWDFKKKNGDTYAGERRTHHMDYGWFNNAPAQRRRKIRGQLIAIDWSCLHQGLNVPRKQAPSGLDRQMNGQRPWCFGDGRTATRWLQEKGVWGYKKGIPCMNKACEYRQEVQGRPTPCKLKSVLRFQLLWNAETIDWSREKLRDEAKQQAENQGQKFDGESFDRQFALSDLRPIARWSTKSDTNASNLQGLKEELDEAAIAMELARGEWREDSKGSKYLHIEEGSRLYNPAGYRFTMTMEFKTNPELRRNYAVVTFQPEVAPTDFLSQKMRALGEIRKIHHVSAMRLENDPGAVTDDDVIEADVDTVTDQVGMF